MAQTQGKTGKAGSITISSNVIPITKWSAKINFEFADATDSGNYDSGSGRLPKSQLAGDDQMEVTIEGNWDAATTSTNLLALLKAPNSGPYAVVLKIDASTPFANGNFDLTDAETTLEVPGATTVKYTCNAKSNGLYVVE